jgi:hypothetical protein
MQNPHCSMVCEPSVCLEPKQTITKYDDDEFEREWLDSEWTEPEGKSGRAGPRPSEF